MVENGYLTKVTEHTALDKNSGIPLDTLVSMNMWGLQPSIFEELELVKNALAGRKIY